MNHGVTACFLLALVLPACSGKAVMDGTGPLFTCNDAPVAFWSHTFPGGSWVRDVLPGGGDERLLVGTAVSKHDQKVISRVGKHGQVFSERIVSYSAGPLSARRAHDGGLVLGGTAAGQELWFGLASWEGDLLSSTNLGPGHYNTWNPVEVLPHPEGGYIVSSFSGGNPVGAKQLSEQYLLLYRLEASGNELWSRSRLIDSSVSVVSNPSNNLVVITPNGDIVQLTRQRTALDEAVTRLVRTSAAGELIWDRSFGAETFYWPQDLTVLPNGELLVLGTADDKPSVLRLSSDGAQLQRETYGNFSGDRFHAFAVLADGTFAIAGVSYGPEAHGSKLWLLHLDADLQVRWDYLSDFYASPISMVKTERGFAIGGIAGGGLMGQAWFAEGTVCER